MFVFICIWLWYENLACLYKYKPQNYHCTVILCSCVKTNTTLNSLLIIFKSPLKTFEVSG